MQEKDWVAASAELLEPVEEADGQVLVLLLFEVCWAPMLLDLDGEVLKV